MSTSHIHKSGSGAPPKKMGRPTISIDFNVLDDLLKIQCTLKECAAFFDCSEDTIERVVQKEFNKTFAEYSPEKRRKGLVSLRRVQFRQAVEEGNTRMLVWLGQQYLGQSDKLQQKIEGEINNNHFVFTPELLEEMRTSWGGFQKEQFDVSRN